MKYIFFSFAIFLIGESLQAQSDDQKEGEIEDVQVIIEKDKPLVLPKANRLYDKTKIERVEPVQVSELQYQVNEPDYQSELYNPKFDPKPIQKTAQTTTNDNFVKVGFGNYISPLVEGYVGLNERKNNIGLWLKHESFGKGPVRDEKSAFAQNQFKIDGDYVARYFKLKPVLEYNREDYYYYGYDRLAYLASSTNLSDVYLQDRIVFQGFSIGTEFTYIKSEDWQVNLKPVFSRYSMKETGESSFNVDNEMAFSTHSFYNLNEEVSFHLRTHSFHSKYTSGDSFNRSLAYAAGGVGLKYTSLSINAGLALGISKDSTTRFYVYPDVSVQYDLNDRISLRAEVTGDLQANSIGTLQATNRYLDDSLILLNTNKPLIINGLVNIQVLDQFWVQGFTSYEVIKNQLLFQFSDQDTSRYKAVYDKNFGRFEIGGKGVYSLYGHTTISMGMSFYGYNKSNQEVAWFMPHRKIQFSIENKAVKGLKTKLNLTVLGGIKAPYTNPSNDPALLGEYTKLDEIVDLGLDVNYQIMDQLGTFVTFNNLINQQYERYSNYPSRGLTAKIGFIYHF